MRCRSILRAPFATFAIKRLSPIAPPIRYTCTPQPQEGQMTTQELNEIVDQRLSDPSVLGRLVCNLRSSEEVHQRHNDVRQFTVRWQDCGDFWRCTVADAENPSRRLAQVDLHEN